MPSVGEALKVVLGVDADPMIKGLKRAQRDLEGWGKSVEGSLEKISGAADALGTLFGVALTGGIAEMIKSTLENVSVLQDHADMLGLNVEKYQAYRFAAGQAGVANETFDAALTKFTQTLGEAASGSQDAADKFAKWGISIRDSGGNIRSNVDVLNQFADRIKGLEDPTLRLAAATELSGRSGAAWVNFLRQGSDGLADMEGKARSLGAVLDEETIRKGKETNDQLKAMGDIISTRLSAALLEFLPTLEATAAMMEKLARAIHEVGTGAEGLPSWLGGAGGDPGKMSAERLLNEITAIDAQLQILQNRDAKIPGWLKWMDEETGNRIQNLQETRQALLEIYNVQKSSADVMERAAKTGGGSSTGFTPVNVKGLRDLDDYLQKLERQHDLAGMTARDQAINNALIEAESIARRDNIALTDDYIARVREAAAANYDMQQAIKEVRDVSRDMARSVTAGLKDILNGTKSVTDGFSGLIDMIEDVFLKIMIEKPLENAFSGLLGGVSDSKGGGLLGGLIGGIDDFFAGFFEEGGNIPSGKFGIVGENGPELAYGDSRGLNIVPPSKLSPSNDNGGNSVTNYYIDARGADEAAIARLEARLTALAGPGVVERRVVEAQQRGAIRR